MPPTLALLLLPCLVTSAYSAAVTLPSQTLPTQSELFRSVSNVSTVTSRSLTAPEATSWSSISLSANSTLGASATTTSVSLASFPTAISSSASSSAYLSSTLSVSSSRTNSASEPTSTLDPGTLRDIQTIRERRLSIIVEGLGPASNVSAWLSSLGNDGKWPDSEVDYTTGCTARRANWPAEVHWSRIVTMAAAWHGGLEGGGGYVNSASLLEAVLRAMDYWFAHDFTVPGCLDSGGLDACPCGTPGFWNTNWFSNIIGVPEFVGEACLLVGAPNLTPTQLSNCTNILDRSFGTFDRFVNGLGFLTGANTLDVAKIGIDSGLLTDNATLIADGYTRIHKEVVVHNEMEADGIRADGSFGQHGGIIYNGNYGKDYTNDVLALEIAAAGTQYSAQNAGTGSQTAFETLLNGDLWMIYRNVLTGVLHWDFSVLSRFISFPVSDNQATGSIKINISQIEELGNLWGSATLESVYASLDSTSEDADAGKIVGNRMFYTNDYMVHRGSGYVSTLRMYSSRTQDAECDNSQDPFGFHLSDGTLYTYLQGNEYEDIAAAWDWNLIPGTTTDYAATNLSCAHTQFFGKEAFVGGASDGSIGAAAMWYTNPYTGTLSFQKAWFFLDDDIQHIMIASVVSNSSAAHPIISILDQKRLNGKVYVDGRPLQQGGNFSCPHSLWHDNVGYTFDSSAPKSQVDLAVDFGERSGNWSSIGISTVGQITVDLFSAWINHGAASIGSLAVPAAYTAFPATTIKEFERKSSKTQLTTIQNDEEVSAVFDATHRTAMFVFWKAQGGSVSFRPSLFDASITVEASAGSVVLYRLDEGAVTASDPSQTLTSLDLTFKVGLLRRRPKGWGWKLKKEVSMTLPTGGVAGSSVSQTLS